MTDATLLSMDNPVFKAFGFYAMVVILKMFVVQLSVPYRRITRKSFSTPEDIKMNDPSGKLKVIKNDDVVERHRSAHLNDMENIIPFVLVGLFYVATNPAASTAILLFRIFTGSRIVHSIVYLGQVPQPARALSFFVSMTVNCVMAIFTLQAFL